VFFSSQHNKFSMRQKLTVIKIILIVQTFKDRIFVSVTQFSKNKRNFYVQEKAKKCTQNRAAKSIATKPCG
jgi:hypothetical protein